MNYRVYAFPYTYNLFDDFIKRVKNGKNSSTDGGALTLFFRVAEQQISDVCKYCFGFQPTARC